jgi:hypothetical protein
MSRGHHLRTAIWLLTRLRAAGYTSKQSVARLLMHTQLVDTAVGTYARHGWAAWTLLGEFPVPPAAVDRSAGSTPAHRTPASFTFE